MVFVGGARPARLLRANLCPCRHVDSHRRSATPRATQQDGAPQKLTERDASIRSTDGGGPASSGGSRTQESAEAAGDFLGPISLSFSEYDANFEGFEGLTDAELKEQVREEKKSSTSIHSMSTATWREKYEKDGAVDLWVEEEFNSGSRLKGGRAVYNGETYGVGSGEGPSKGIAPTHHVTIHDHRHDQVVKLDIPEDRYILWEAEDAGLKLPNACRMGCCTACAVRVTEGSVWQPEALGISKGLKDQGFALMCVGYPTSDCVMETVDEDEIYDMQFGKPFADLALEKGGGSILRDDFALELAEMDE